MYKVTISPKEGKPEIVLESEARTPARHIEEVCIKNGYTVVTTKEAKAKVVKFKGVDNPATASQPEPVAG